MSQPAKAPKVSVCVSTYNHERYIRQCLQSLVDQITDFDYEIIVGDDCSTDGTTEIVCEFAERYPHLVRAVLRTTNIGASLNYRYIHNLARGQYIAHVDGDDYYFEDKLRIQAAFLDKNPTCQILWHKMMILLPSGGEPRDECYDFNKIDGVHICIDNIISSITIGCNSSKMYRSWRGSPKDELEILDFSENILQLSQTGGHAAFIGDKPLGVYRAGQGISTNRAYIRRHVYLWLLRFYNARIASRSVVAARVLMMVLSDLRHLCPSALIGVLTLMKVAPAIRIGALKDLQTLKMFIS